MTSYTANAGRFRHLSLSSALHCLSRRVCAVHAPEHIIITSHESQGILVPLPAIICSEFELGRRFYSNRDTELPNHFQNVNDNRAPDDFAIDHSPENIFAHLDTLAIRGHCIQSLNPIQGLAGVPCKVT